MSEPLPGESAMKPTDERSGLETRLHKHVTTLARTPRTPGSAEHQQAAAYIEL